MSVCERIEEGCWTSKQQTSTPGNSDKLKPNSPANKDFGGKIKMPHVWGEKVMLLNGKIAERISAWN